MILEMKVPSPGESITEVEIAQWLVKDGDYVEKDQPIAEVDSDKATLELPAEKSGVVSLKANEGDTVAVGEIVCLINTEETGPKSENSTETIIEKIEPKINKKTEIISDDKNYASGSSSPAAKKILDEKGISSNEIVGTGRNGRITKQDAVNAKASMGSAFDPENDSSKSKLSHSQCNTSNTLPSASA